MKFGRRILLLAVVLSAGLALAQTQPETFTINATAQCATIRAANNSVVGIVVTGTWSGTFSPTLKIYGATTGVAKKVTPLDGSAQATITANGAYTAAVGGFTEFDLCSTGTWTSGTATVQLYATPAPNVGSLGGGSGSAITAVNGGTGLNGGGSSGALTLNLNTALPNGETATTQAAGDSTTKVASDAFVLANAPGFVGGVDGSAGYVSGDPCATIATNLTTAVATNPQSIDLYLGRFASIFPNGIVPCNSNPFENQVFSGRIYLGPTQFVKSVPWLTPGGNERVGIFGDGTSDPGVAIASANSTLTDCDSDAPGWNGTACVIGAVTVAAFPSTGHCITFTYPHGAFGAGTYCPSLWLGGQGPAGVTFGGSFGQVISDFNIQPGNGGGNFGVYNTGIQEQSYCSNVIIRASNNAGFFYDKVQGNASGPGHFAMSGCTARAGLNVGQAPAQGYPNVANQIGMGYGIFAEGNGIVIWFSGGTCTTYPQGYPTGISGGAINTIKMTYAGSCSNVAGLTCHVGSQHGGSGETCAATTSVNTVTAITAGGVGTGYSLADTQTGGPFEIENATINGKNTQNMQEAIVIDGFFSPAIHSIHTGFDAGYGIHIGYGAGLVNGGYFGNNDLENASLGTYRFGVGIDQNQVVLATPRGGTVQTITDDVCPTDSVGTATVTPPPIFSPCGLAIQGTGFLDQNNNPWIQQTPAANAVDGITVANAAAANPATVSVSASGTDTNINLSVVPKGTGVDQFGATQVTTATTSSVNAVQISQGANGPANAAAPAVLNVSAAAAGGLAGASNAGSAGAAIGLLTGAGSAGGATTGIGGAGGAVTVTEGAGGAAGGTATNNGGNGGGVAWATGAGGNGGTGAATAGSGGNFVVTLGAPGTNSATGTVAPVGQFQVTGNSPASTANALAPAAGTIFNVSAVTGGADTAATGTAGVGSTVSINSGTGGAASGATSGTGGVGGAINITSGNGGASSGTGANPNGGNVVLTLGKAGVGGSGGQGVTGQFNVAGTAIASQGPAGLNAGTMVLISGLTGGASSGASSTAGTGSAVTVNTGAGGTSSGGTAGTGGAGGTFAVAGGAGGGAAGAGAGGAGGAITLTPGAGTAGGATGNGGAAGASTHPAATGGAGGATSGTGGAGSDFLVTTGTGGAATAGSTTGRGGNATITLGSAGGTGTAGAPGIFTVAAGTVGGSNTTSTFNVTNTLNTSGVVGGNNLFNTTCTAAAANSKDFDFQIGGVSQLNITFLTANCVAPVLTSLGQVKAGTAGGNASFNDISTGFLTTSMSTQSSATLTAITNMTWAIVASKNYRLSCEIPVTLTSTATLAFGLVGPGTPTSYNLDVYGAIGAAAAFADLNILAQTTWVSTKTSASGALAGTAVFHVNAQIQNGSTAGTLTLDTSNVAASGTIQVLANSVCNLTQAN